MIKNFECWDCQCRFEADDKSFVTCPKCKSENVEYASFHMPRWVLWLAGVCVLSIILLLILINIDFNAFFHNKGEQTNQEQLVTDSVQQEIKAVTDDPSDEPIMEVSDPEYNGKNYSVNVSVRNIPNGIKYYYARLDHFDNTVVLQRSDNGHFTDIPYCSDDGFSYDFAVYESNTDTLLCEPIVKSGFIKQIEVVKMSAEDLQSLIDKQDNSLLGEGENSSIAPNCHLSFTGIKEKGLPTIFSEVFERLSYGEWKSVKVTKLEYDKKNRISSVTMAVVPEDKDF